MNRERAMQQAAALLQREDCRTLAMEVGVLLPLPLWQEQDLYELLAPDICRAAKMRGPIDFALLRQEARGRTLADVYDDLSLRGVGANVRRVAGKERALRMRLPVLMEDAQALLREAKRLGKHTILYALGMPMLTNADVQQMLLDRGAALPDELCIDHWTGDPFAVGTLMLSEARREAGWRHIRVPSPVEAVARRYAGHKAAAYLGMRAMLAMSAMHPQGAELGMHLLAQAVWLADESCRAGYDRVAFIGQGMVRQAFETVCAALDLPLDAADVPITAQAAFPLHFEHMDDLLRLPRLTRARTPKALLDLFAPVTEMPQTVRSLQEWGFMPNAPLEGEEQLRFLDALRTYVYDDQRFGEYRERAACHLLPLLTERTAVCCGPEDMGLAGLLADVADIDLPVLALHTADDLADQGSIGYRTLFGGTPDACGAVRSRFLAEDVPPAVRYGYNHVLRAEKGPEFSPAMQALQANALAFVQAMADTFGKELPRLCFRPGDGCEPFERFLMTAPAWQMKALCGPGAAGEEMLHAWRQMQRSARWYGAAFAQMERSAQGFRQGVETRKMRKFSRK